MPSQSTNVFVSYSHADASLVAPVVKLLRVNKSLVFQDIDDIPPGKIWRSEIAKALAESQLVVVFWCNHASRSNEVSKEWKAAIEQEKDLLPLLLDATPLPTELGEYQWIDFRGMVGANHNSIDASATDIETSNSQPPLAVPSKSVRWLPLAGLATAFVAVATLSLFTWIELQAPLPVPRSYPEQNQTSPPPLETFDFVFSNNILIVLGVFFAAACLAWLLRQRSTRGKPAAGGRPHHDEIERRMASELEAEILRRNALRRDNEV